MIINRIIAGPYEENCYLIMDEDTKECGIIDPGGNVETIESVLKNINAKPKYILLTHGHFDHVGGVDELSKKLNLNCYVSKIDAEYMQKDSTVFGTITIPSVYVKEGDRLKLGNHIVKVIETPGHTLGGLCFLIENKLFTGDTLFQGSVGRSDFVGGNAYQLVKSIKDKLLPLGDEIEVYPGHGEPSKIGYEKRVNPYLK